MKRLLAVVCFMLAATSFGFAQDKARDPEKKATVASKAKPEMPQGAQAATEKVKGSTMGAEMSAKGEQAKKEPSAKQKASQAKKACEKQAKEQKLKSDERKKFMKDCLSK